jgi:hypothetical protein
MPLPYYLTREQKDPFKEANKYYKQIPDTLRNALNPYIQQGQTATNKVSDVFGNLIDDPTKILNAIGGQYQQSPGYKFALEQALNAANNAAAAGGTLGTPMHQQQSMDIASGLASRDYENFLNHGLNLYGTGLSGTTGLSNRGFDASKSLAESLASLLSQQGQMSALGANMQNQAANQNWSNIFSTAAQVLPYFL